MASEEKSKILAVELIEWVQQANNETQMIFLKGYSEAHLNFQQEDMGWTQPCPDTEGDCHIFHIESRTEGGLKPLATPCKEYCNADRAAVYIKPGYNAGLPYVIGIKGLGNDSKGEVVFTIDGLSESVCRAANKLLGLTDTFPLDTYTSVRYEFAPGAAVPEPAMGANSQIGDEVPELAGKKTFCVRDGSYSGTNSKLIQVLKVR